MSDIDVQVDPAEAGFDAERLARIDAHFDRYVDDGRLPGWLTVVSRGGRIVHVGKGGRRDVEAGLPVEHDTLFRIYSMTKPITSIAAMILVEEGALGLTDPVSRYLPAFGDQRVYLKGTAAKPVTEPVTTPMRVWHLLTHTAGLSYGFHHVDPVDELYRAAGFEWGTPSGMDLAACCDAWAELPLLFQPGAEWTYSHATDVLGRVIEVVSGQSLDTFFRERIFAPLDMADTTFGPADPSRLAALYAAVNGRTVRYDVMGDAALHAPSMLAGGGGLISSARDYHRFARMLAGGGALDGVRIVGSRTLRYMTRNHLPGGADLEEFGRPLFAEVSYAGVGFGLGFSVVVDPVAYKVLSSPGEFGWGGAASTSFWVDPVEDLTVLFLTQLLPSSTYPIRTELRTLVYQALVD